MITVADLRKALSLYPDDMRVVVDGYEHGFADIDVIRSIPIVANANGEKSGIYGAHDTPSWTAREATETALVIGEGRWL